MGKNKFKNNSDVDVPPISFQCYYLECYEKKRHVLFAELLSGLKTSTLV